MLNYLQLLTVKSVNDVRGLEHNRADAKKIIQKHAI